MGFIMGLLGGVVAGAAGAMWYSQQTGRDLRDEFRQVRSEIQARDFDGLASHLEDRVKELQGSIDKMRAEANERSDKSSDDMAGDVRSAADEAAEAARSAADEPSQA